jgi:CRISPR-associated endonuclease/helicase Cas3
MDQEPYFAHSANQACAWHRLDDHLNSVAAKARVLAGSAPWAEEAELAGKLHDIAKYGDLFQGRLRGERSGIDHWSLGARIALRTTRTFPPSLPQRWCRPCRGRGAATAQVRR